MSHRLAELRSHRPATQQTFHDRDEASMRWLERSMAAAAIAVVVLLALIR